MQAIHCTNDFWICPGCQYEYNVNATGVLTTTAREGTLLISYKGYPYNTEGQLLIPDHPDFLEAIYHYCLMKYHNVQVLKNNEGSYRERDWHLRRFATLSLKTKSLNMPDLDTLENIKNEQTRMLPVSNRHREAFIGMGVQENLKY